MDRTQGLRDRWQAESRDDVELLRSMAERLADARRVLAAD